MEENRVLKNFSKIIRAHGPISSLAYDQLTIKKPSRWALSKRFGSWNQSLEAAKEFLASQGFVCQQPSAPNESPNTGASSDDQVLQLTKQVHELSRLIQSPQLILEGVRHKFGYLTDCHLGSLYADEALLASAYDIFQAERIKTVFNTGDLSDGQKMHKGHEYELKVHGSDAHVKLIVNTYPYRKGIKTYFITGNHDWSFWKEGGTDIGLQVAAQREDMVYLGYQEADIALGEGDCKATVRLFHPEDGTAYAISYKTQRYIAELPSGTKPDILLCGHYHKVEFLPYRGVMAYQGGTTQQQTPWMRGKKIAAIMGFWIIEVLIAPERVLRVQHTFFPVRT